MHIVRSCLCRQQAQPESERAQHQQPCLSICIDFVCMSSNVRVQAWDAESTACSTLLLLDNKSIIHCTGWSGLFLAIFSSKAPRSLSMPFCVYNASDSESTAVNNRKFPGCAVLQTYMSWNPSRFKSITLTKYCAPECII